MKMILKIYKKLFYKIFKKTINKLLLLTFNSHSRIVHKYLFRITYLVWIKYVTTELIVTGDNFKY